MVSLVEQQLKTEMEQLRTDNKDLLAQVKLHKDDLTAANECKNRHTIALRITCIIYIF